MLIERDRLADLRPGPDLEANLRRRIEEELPFHLRSSYGGNTTCVEVQTPDALLILDCGSGFRELGVVVGADAGSRNRPGPERTAPCPRQSSSHRSHLRHAVFRPLLRSGQSLHHLGLAGHDAQPRCAVQSQLRDEPALFSADLRSDEGAGRLSPHRAGKRFSNRLRRASARTR